MLKKTIKISSILLLSLFSFYYTNKSIDLIREQDPIMKQLKIKDGKYNIEATNATIKENTIIPGKNGKEIDYETSYNKMKQYGAYNETLMTLKEVRPTVSIENYYDKYIISGNKEKKSVALVFKINKDTPKDIITILNTKDIKATFFIDGLYLENNYQEISTMTNFQLELLSYNSKYEELEFTSSKNYLESLIGKQLRYCYSETEQEEVINLCEKLNMHTIIPTIKIKDNLYQEIKENLTNAAIISIPLSERTKKQLPIAIDYIKSRGYTIETLEALLSENIDK